MVESNVETGYRTSEKEPRYSKRMYGTILFGAFGIFGIIAGVITYHSVKRENEQKSQTKELINKAVRYAAGNDKIFDTKEKAELINAVGLDYVIQEGEVLLLSHQNEDVLFKVGSGVHFYEIGRVSRVNLEEYIGRHKEKGK